MLDSLVSTIQTVRQRIIEHGSYLDEAAPEARTRASLIDPLLQALGWDVGDPNLVEIEPRAANGRADYGLRRNSGEPVLLLEAKKLRDSSVPYEQIASYVVAENMKRATKIPYCAVTNGSRWLVFDVFAQSLVLDVSVEREEPTRCALRLLCLWRHTLSDVGVLEAVAELRPTPSDDSQTPRRTSVEPSPAPARTNRDVAWTALDSEGMEASREVLPSHVRFPDRSGAQVSSWAGMLVEVVYWLHASRLLRRQEMPFVVAGSRYCVSEDGRRPDGTPFGRSLTVRDTGIQIEGDFTGKQIVRFAVDLLKRYEVRAAEVSLKLVRSGPREPT